MSTSALERLLADAETLVDAIDGGEIEAIEAANLRLAASVAAVGAAGAWRDEPGARNAAVHGLRVATAARVRVNYHADRTRQRMAAVAGLRGGAGAHAYDRRGRLRG